MRRASFPFIFVCLSLAFSALSTDADDKKPPVFESHIKRLLSRKCGRCHSENIRKGGLDLSSMAGLRHGGESGESSIAESADDSLLWMMIEGEEMPPEDQPQLTPDEIHLIRRWIEAGSPSESPADQKPTLTQHDVLPILLLRCTACHGETLQQGGVDLRTFEAIMRGGKNGPSLIAGAPDASLILQRIESNACPPREQLLKFFVKRPPRTEVDILRDWIAAGAVKGTITPDVATTEPDLMVTEEDRQHWAFQPPRISRPGASIDDWIQEQLIEAGLSLNAEADRNTLIRRAWLDLTGLPPSPAEWKRWRDETNSAWYAQMIDHLLAAPQYGERWGRYWLDLAGYADSEGGVSSDPVRKVAWKYRDYVVQAFNNDKPYDEFLTEQIAGDELIDHDNAVEVTEEIVENLTATGFLRMGIDQTGSRTMNFVPERIGVISDAIAIVGSGIMGLTMECARCHSHKYDPIPHRDYYRFKAIFQGAFDEHDWLSFRNRSLNIATRQHHQLANAINPPLIKKLNKLKKEHAAATYAVNAELLIQHYPNQSEGDRAETLNALKIADNNRTLQQRLLVTKLQEVALLPDSEQPESVQDARARVADLESQTERVQQQLAPSTAIRALWDRGNPSPTYVLRRGDHDKPGRLVGPGVPSALTDGKTPFAPMSPFPEGTPKTGRRLAFAQWLTQSDHPTTSRVLVNRIWYHHFGTGLVKTLENFGVKGERPSHPELLDDLAVTFVKQGWSIKQLHRRIMNSKTYRQSSHVSDERLKQDPQNRLLSRMALRRMDAEALRDSLLFVAGKLDDRSGGRPDQVSIDRNGLVSVNSTNDGLWRRSIYLQYRRTEIPSMMDTFDYPEMGPNCTSRSTSTVSPQSLMLMNNKHVHSLATAFAERAEELLSDAAADDLEARVQTVYELALSRSPSTAERKLGTDALIELNDYWNGNPTAALATYCHTILNSAAFLYID